MQDHEHAAHSKTAGGPTPTGTGSTPVITCGAHGTMRTGGTCSQCQPTDSASTRAHGRENAGQQIITQAAADMPTGRIGHAQTDIAAHPLSEARTLEDQAFAGQYDWAAETPMREPKELDEPGLTPGAPHPDPALAAKGWHVCNHGIYTRHPDGPLEAEPEAC